VMQDNPLEPYGVYDDSYIEIIIGEENEIAAMNRSVEI